MLGQISPILSGNACHKRALHPVPWLSSVRSGGFMMVLREETAKSNSHDRWPAIFPLCLHNTLIY
jgi:hypothetical protein